jgi:hypothetical protein
MVVSFIAGAAIAQYDCVMSNGTTDTVIKTTGNTNPLVVGFAQEAITTAQATAGQKVAVMVSGITKAKCGATTTFGAKLMPDATAGRVQPHTTPGTNAGVGKALADAADGDIFPVLIVNSGV